MCRAVGTRGELAAVRMARVSRHLLAILHSLPPGAGTVTLARIAAAERALGCSTHTVANLLPIRLAGTKAADGFLPPGVWKDGRRGIVSALADPRVSDVLLGYGVSLPSGPNRAAFRAQIGWLTTQLAERSLRVWTFGGLPHHPSRWQRVMHRHRPGSTFEVVAGELFVSTPLSPVCPAAELASSHQALVRNHPSEVRRESTAKQPIIATAPAT